VRRISTPGLLHSDVAQREVLTMAPRLSSRAVRVAILYFVRALFRDTISDFVDALVKIIGIMAEALNDMKPSAMIQFNERTRVNPDVKYFTWAGDCTIPGGLFA